MGTRGVSEVDRRSLSLGNVAISILDYNDIAERALKCKPVLSFSEYVRKELGLKRWQSRPPG